MIPISLIRQYVFCPRIVYYNLLTNIKPIYPRHISLGEDYHKLQEALSKNRKFIKLNIDYKDIILDTYIENEDLNLCGKLDLLLICDDEIIPIEFKWTDNKKPSYSHILQLYGYGLIASKEYEKNFTKSMIVYSNNMKIFNINITDKIKDDFFKIVKSIENIVKESILPNSNADDIKCSQCEYLNFCDDRI